MYLRTTALYSESEYIYIYIYIYHIYHCIAHYVSKCLRIQNFGQKKYHRKKNQGTGLVHNK